MTGKTKRALAATTAIAAVSALAAGSGAWATGERAATLHLVEKGGGLRFVDNAPKARHPYDFSAGDVVIVTRDLFEPNGARAGSLRLVCVATSPSVQQCAGTESLAGGTLEVAGLSAPNPATTAAVVGGTDRYAGARGTSVSRDRRGNGDVADQTIELLP
jgi:hypothetical protein